MRTRSLHWRWTNLFTSLLLPQGCLVCRRPLRGSLLCWRCRPSNPLPSAGLCPACYSVAPLQQGLCPTCVVFPLPYNSVRYLWNYNGCARDLIRAMKFNSSPLLARWMGQLLSENLSDERLEIPWDFITYMPTSFRSGQQRQFNQCELMADSIARHLRKHTDQTVPLRSVLRRGIKRAPHSTLSHERRLTRLQSLFVANHNLSGVRILLVEDVITTGATLAAASFALRAAGAAHIDCIALARAASWSKYREVVCRKLGSSLYPHSL